MENRVYYGEYSLKHWIDLILTKNIRENLFGNQNK